MSTDSVSIGANLQNLEVSPAFETYAGVIIHTDEVDDTLVITAGDISGATGRVLEMLNPWATQAMANRILQDIQGWQYKPYTASAAEIDPAAEIGDGLSAAGMYSGIYTQNIHFTRRNLSEASAPQSEEAAHEYGYETKANRQYVRSTKQIRASLRINAENIEARVTKQSPEGQSSFGWNLQNDRWEIFDRNRTILRASSSGLEVFGRIEAESGHIGGTNGFVITANAIYKNLSRFGGTQTNGVYIGTDGIQLGQNFKVDSSGALTASSGTFSGNVYAGNIQYGGNAGYFSGGGISSGSIYGNRLVGNTVTTAYTSYGINASLGNADWAYGALNGWNTVYNLSVSNGGFKLGDRYVSLASTSFIDGTGRTISIAYLAW